MITREQLKVGETYSITILNATFEYKVIFIGERLVAVSDGSWETALTISEALRDFSPIEDIWADKFNYRLQ